MQLAVEGRLARRQAATSPATLLRTSGRLSQGPKPAAGQQVRAVLCKNLSEERKRAEPKAALLRAESGRGTWRAFLPAHRQEPGGSERHTGTCRGWRPGCGERPPFTTSLATLSWNCYSAQSQGKHCLTLSTTTMDYRQWLPTPLFFFMIFKRKQKRIQTSDHDGVTASP